MTGISENHRFEIIKDPYKSTSSDLWTEGNAIQYLFHISHDITSFQSMIGLDTFNNRLDELFENDMTERMRDTTCTIGNYAHGNEISHHIVFFYFKLRNNEKGCHYLKKIINFYSNKNDGLCGNDDAGQLSAWYVSVANTFYPDDITRQQFLKFNC